MMKFINEEIDKNFAEVCRMIDEYIYERTSPSVCGLPPLLERRGVGWSSLRVGYNK